MLTRSLCLPAAAKSKAEFDFANARTQQEAEQAEQAIRDTTAFLKDALRVKVSARSLRQPTDWRAHCLLRAAGLHVHLHSVVVGQLRCPTLEMLCSCCLEPRPRHQLCPHSAAASQQAACIGKPPHKVPCFCREGADHRCLHVSVGAPTPGG